MRGWILSSSVVIIIVLILRAALKGHVSYRIRYALWLLVLARLLVPVNIGNSVIELTIEKRLKGEIFCTATTMSGSSRNLKERISAIAKRPATAAYAVIIMAAVSAFAVGCAFTGAKPRSDNESSGSEAYESSSASQAESESDMERESETEQGIVIDRNYLQNIGVSVFSMDWIHDAVRQDELIDIIEAARRTGSGITNLEWYLKNELPEENYYLVSFYYNKPGQAPVHSWSKNYEVVELDGTVYIITDLGDLESEAYTADHELLDILKESISYTGGQTSE